MVLEPLVQAWGIEKKSAEKEGRIAGADEARFPESVRIDHPRDAHAVVTVTQDEATLLAPLRGWITECLLLGALTIHVRDGSPSVQITRGANPPCVRCRRRLKDTDEVSGLCRRCASAVALWDAEQPKA
jgi:hypothetical protein